jgi:hypothetical protein
MTEDKLYSAIENAIIKWVIDGTKTAGSLTREIMLIVYSEEDMQEYADFSIHLFMNGLPCIVAKDWFKLYKQQQDEEIKQV